MKLFQISCILLIFIFSSIIFAKDSDIHKPKKDNLIGISYVNTITENDSKYSDIIQLRYQRGYRINDYPIIPFHEVSFAYSITDTSPQTYLSLLFGLKKYFIESESGFSFSGDLGIGASIGKKEDKRNYTSIVYKIAMNIGYQNFLIDFGVGINSGFPFKNTIFAGLNYKF
jgi:hypothetical protein